ncbi:MAG: RNase adapter RapZ [Bdellovibrionota bacterium]
MKVLLVTGLSGSGKSTVIKCLEDLGYYCVDNLPVPMIPSLLDLQGDYWKGQDHLALVVDARDVAHISLLPEVVEQLRNQGRSIEMLFLEASDGILRQRFSETRRKHPLSPSGSVEEGIRAERTLLEPLKEISTSLNTSAFNYPELRALVMERYGGKKSSKHLSIIIQSFGFKYGIPLHSDLVFDVRFLRNPYFQTSLRSLTGKDEKVKSFVLEQKDAQIFLNKVRELLQFLIGCYEKEGKSYLQIAIGCTGGQHRSVAIADYLASVLSDMNYPSTVSHREIDRNRTL